MKKIIYLWLPVICGLGILTGCSATKGLEEDLSSLEGFTCYQFYNSDEEREMKIDEVEVTDKKTEGKQKTVYATVSMSDDMYKKTGDYAFFYDKVSSKWELSDYGIMEEPEYIILDNSEGKSVLQEETEGYLQDNGIIQYSAGDITENEGQLCVSYEVDSQLKYCEVKGQVTGTAVFYYDGEGCSWDCNTNDEAVVSWKLEGDYGAEYVKYDGDGIQEERDICAFTIDKTDFENNRVHIQNLDQYNNDYESASKYGGLLIRKGEKFGWTDMEIGIREEDEEDEENEYDEEDEGVRKETSVSLTVNANEIIFYPDEAYVVFGYDTDKQVELMDRDSFDKLPVNLFYYPKEDGSVTKELTTRQLIDYDSTHRVIFYTLADITGEYSSKERKNKYQIDGKYTKLKGTIHLSDAAQPDEKCLVNIYGDGKKLYTFNKFKGDNREQDFTVDITGVKTLELGIFPYFHGESSSGGFVNYYPTIYVNDVILETE